MPLTWRGTQLKRLAPFVVGGLLGVPQGIFLLGVLDPMGFKLGLGLFLLIYCPPCSSPSRPGRCAGRGVGEWRGVLFVSGVALTSSSIVAVFH